MAKKEPRRLASWRGRDDAERLKVARLLMELSTEAGCASVRVSADEPLDVGALIGSVRRTLVLLEGHCDG